ncbi:MAG: hypothetical protein AAF754_13680 [Pseudomonadota bacterium]
MDLKRFGATRKELLTRLWISLGGLVFMVGGLVYRGLPTHPGGWEAVILAVVFFGASIALIARRLIRQEHPSEE